MSNEPITKEEYFKLTPKQQGYLTYMRAEWDGWSIPKKNPHEKGTKEHLDWETGAFNAYISVLDCDDE